MLPKTTPIVMHSYCQTSNLRCTLVGNNIVDHSDVVGSCWHCSNYIFIVELAPGFNWFRWKTFSFWYLMRIIFEVCRHCVLVSVWWQFHWMQFVWLSLLLIQPAFVQPCVSGSYHWEQSDVMMPTFLSVMTPQPWFNIKILYYKYKISHSGYKMVRE